MGSHDDLDGGGGGVEESNSRPSVLPRHQKSVSLQCPSQIYYQTPFFPPLQYLHIFHSSKLMDWSQYKCINYPKPRGRLKLWRICYITLTGNRNKNIKAVFFIKCMISLYILTFEFVFLGIHHSGNQG